MDTQLLKAFVTVASTGSFSDAAQTLHITQPAVSKRITALEQQINCLLFDRANRTISLTEAGRALLPRAHSILKQLDEAQRVLSDLKGTVAGELKLTTSHHIGLHHLPKYLKRFTDKYPEVRLSLNFQDSEIALNQVLQGETELAVITLAQNTHPKLTETLVWEDPLQFVVAPNHPLAQEDSLSLINLSQYPAILPELNTYTTSLVSELFNQHQLPLELRMATNYLETIKMMVTIGLGWSLLPETLLTDSELKTLSVNSVHVHRRLGLIHHKDRSLSNASQAFLKLFSDKDV
ncbi:LysR family transcriptional regulator [Sessilibacter corallicola]|uniref:LysR family transcriptional regulator n=1 Tax=Sessilibacter corallicola TaxID=2904075 RepID=A0ABQ0A475_9GAMM